ncbi:hypothetical protein DV736_g2437, partial [Chaetothyriales sp. CBS 134916]
MSSDGSFAVLLGALSSVLAWSLSFYPQPWLNWRRGSTTGFAIDFPLLNLLGFACHVASTSAFLYSPTIRHQYAQIHRLSPEPTVRFNDLVFGVHALILCVVTYSQFFPRLWRLELSPVDGVSPPVLGIIVGSLGSIAVTIVLVLGSDQWQWLDVIYVLSYIKLLVTFIKYIPQAILNYRRQSTEGWSIVAILFDMTGGVLSLLQLVIDASFQGDWSGITGNPLKLGLAIVSMGYDLIFMVQHYILYPESGHVDAGRQHTLFDRESYLVRETGSPQLEPTIPNFDSVETPPPDVKTREPSPLPSSDNETRTGARRRRGKTKPSQSDTVLLRQIDPNRPDIANHAGEHALDSESEGEEEGHASRHNGYQTTITLVPHQPWPPNHKDPVSGQTSPHLHHANDDDDFVTIKTDIFPTRETRPTANGTYEFAIFRFSISSQSSSITSKRIAIQSDIVNAVSDALFMHDSSHDLRLCLVVEQYRLLSCNSTGPSCEISIHTVIGSSAFSALPPSTQRATGTPARTRRVEQAIHLPVKC